MLGEMKLNLPKFSALKTVGSVSALQLMLEDNYSRSIGRAVALIENSNSIDKELFLALKDRIHLIVNGSLIKRQDYYNEQVEMENKCSFALVVICTLHRS